MTKMELFKKKMTMQNKFPNSLVYTVVRKMSLVTLTDDAPGIAKKFIIT